MSKILKYIFNHYIQSNVENVSLSRDSLILELQQEGFSGKEITQALGWLASLLAQQQNHRRQRTTTKPIRVFTENECELLNTRSRGLLLQLEWAENLDPETREFIIKQLMTMHNNDSNRNSPQWFLSMMSILDRERSNPDGK